MKARPELVNPYIVDLAISNPRVKKIQDLYGEYVRLTNLRPGCDTRDLIEWLKKNRPDSFEFEKPYRKLKGGEG